MVSLCAELGRECWTGEILDPPAAYEEQPPFLPEAFKQGSGHVQAWHGGMATLLAKAGLARVSGASVSKEISPVLSLDRLSQLTEKTTNGPHQLIGSEA